MHLENLTISVVIPIRGKIELLSRALQSCVIQSLRPSEIVLIDDSIEDNERESIEKIAKDFNRRIKLIQIPIDLTLLTSNGRGVSVARNLGIQASNGRYIAFLDADDYFLPEKLATQTKAMVVSESEISHTNYLKTDTELGISSVVDTSFNKGDKQDSAIAFRDCAIATPTVMIKSTLVSGQMEIFPEEFSFGEDLMAWALLCKISSGPLLHIPQTLSVVEVNSASNSSSVYKTNMSRKNLEKYAQIHGIKPLKIYEFGGLKSLTIRLIPLPKKVVCYLLNILRAVKGN